MEPRQLKTLTTGGLSCSQYSTKETEWHEEKRERGWTNYWLVTQTRRSVALQCSAVQSRDMVRL
jgi:hypothetical protein